MLCRRQRGEPRRTDKEKRKFVILSDSSCTKKTFPSTASEWLSSPCSRFDFLAFRNALRPSIYPMIYHRSVRETSAYRLGCRRALVVSLPRHCRSISIFPSLSLSPSFSLDFFLLRSGGQKKKQSCACDMRNETATWKQARRSMSDYKLLTRCWRMCR